MPTAKVDDPRQNYHGWWGTVKADPYAKDNGGTNGLVEEEGYQYVFIKTSREAHFVAQGTVVHLHYLSDDAEEAVRAVEQGVGTTAAKLIRSDLESLLEVKVKYYTIDGVDYEQTPSLTRMLNIITEGCFNNENWLSGAGDIGVESIQIGRELPRLKSMVSEVSEVS
jgi:hypothetical protein